MSSQIEGLSKYNNKKASIPMVLAFYNSSSKYTTSKTRALEQCVEKNTWDCIMETSRNSGNRKQESRKEVVKSINNIEFIPVPCM